MFSIFSSNFLTIRDKLFLFHLVNIIQFSIYFQVLINLNNLIYIFIAFLLFINLAYGESSVINKWDKSKPTAIEQQIRQQREADNNLSCTSKLNNETKKLERVCDRKECQNEFIDGQWIKTCR